MSIDHNAETGRFETEVEGNLAYLAYRSLDDHLLEYYSTYVPSELRGRGLAGRIVKEALDFARENGYSVRPTCPFVSKFIERHPDYHQLLES